MTATSRPRNTRQRTAIRTTLDLERDFRTAQQVHDRLRQSGEKMGLATVYRTLQSLVEQGEADVIRTPDGEMAFRQCSRQHHHHLICRRCGATVEIAAHQIEAWAGQVAAQYGFTEVSHEIELLGLCQGCSAGTAADAE